MVRVHSVQVGKVAPLGPNDVPSGFVKRSIAHRAAVRELGLEGDEQADLRVHGGPEKAVYGYSLDHYASWTSEHPEHASILVAGAFGENLTVEGMTEADICAGDVHRIGTALLQVCQPRQPCFKLALHFGDKQLPAAMVKSGRSGWYYRVLCEGTLGRGDEIELVDRPLPNLPFQRLIDFVNFGSATDANLAAMSCRSEVASGIRRRALAKRTSREKAGI